MKQHKQSILYFLLFGTLTVFLGYAFFVWTLLPYRQMTRYYGLINAFKKGDVSVVQKFRDSNEIFEPYTYLQPDIRNELMYEAFIAAQQEKEGARELMLFGIDKLEEVIEKEKNYMKYYHSLARAYTDLAQDGENKEWYLAKAEEYYGIARTISPESPEIAYMYSISLNNQKRFTESIALLEEFISKDPRVMNSYYYYGLALYRSGPVNYDKALENFEKALSALKKIEYSEINKQNYQKLFAHYYEKKDKDRFLLTAKRLTVLDPKQSGLYEQVVEYVESNDRIPVIRIN